MSKLLPLLAMTLLFACSIGSRPNNDLYVLKADIPASARMSPLHIRIDEPAVGPALDTHRIAVMDMPTHLTYYTGAAWAKPLPRLLQGFLIDAFQQSQAFRSVSSDEETVLTDVVLLTDVSEYAVDNSTNPPSVRVRLTGKLVQAGNRKIIATIPVSQTVAAEVNHMPDIVTAFNRATNRAALALIKALLKAPAKAGPAAK